MKHLIGDGTDRGAGDPQGEQTKRYQRRSDETKTTGAVRMAWYQRQVEAGDLPEQTRPEKQPPQPRIEQEEIERVTYQRIPPSRIRPRRDVVTGHQAP